MKNAGFIGSMVPQVASTSSAISEEKLVEREETEAIKICPFLRPTAKCFAVLGYAMIAKVSTDILKSH